MALSIVQLSVSEGAAESFLIPAGAGSYTVGRRVDNDLTIQHDSISGLHARIEASGVNGVDLVDCGSSNGTYVNGEKVERCELKAGDTIRFASTKFKVQETAEKIDAAVEKEKQALLDEINLLKSQQQRETATAEEQAGRLSSDLSSVRETVLEKEKQIATLQFEVSRRDTSIQHLEEKLQEVSGTVSEWQNAHHVLESELAQTRTALEESQGEAASLQSRLEVVLEKVSSLSQQWREDWSYWTSFENGEATGAEDSGMESLEALDRLRGAIREQLDRIEPVWKEFGDASADELKKRCERLSEQKKALEAEGESKLDELSAMKKELAQVREDMDREVRRASGLSRRNVEVEMPERYESMVIAKDREKELFLALIEQIEFFDRLIEGYRRSKKMKEALYELEDFKKRLTGILEANGVDVFEIEVGVFLTLKNRREVKVFGKKGWGTREYMEQPFQPGKVTKVIRPGYRAGSGESAVILRKVEVLIQEAEG